MVHVPKKTAGWTVYWAGVAGVMLAALAGASVLRRAHGFDSCILAEARRHRLPPALVSAVIWRESRYDPLARGDAGEIGLMQVTAAAAADWAAEQGEEAVVPDHLWHPRTNITVGTWYLARALRYWEAQHCDDPVPFALAEYNAGRRNAQRWAAAGGASARTFIDAIGFPTTRDYVEDILRRTRGRG